MENFYHPNITADSVSDKISLNAEETCLCFKSFYILSHFQRCLDWKEKLICINSDIVKMHGFNKE